MQSLEQCHIGLYEPVFPVTRLLLYMSRGGQVAGLPRDVWLCVIRRLMALHMNQCIDHACEGPWRVKLFRNDQYMVIRDDAKRTYNTMEFPWEPRHEYITVLYRDRALYINNLYYAPYRYPIALARSGAQQALVDWSDLGPWRQILCVFIVLIMHALWNCGPTPLFPSTCTFLL